MPDRLLDTRTGIGVPAAGKVAALGIVHLLADVAGYYTGDPDTGFVPTLT
ncbi:MAG: hypothetical protein WCC60_14100 [Ilumatobacteraceae bacterium]